MSSMSLQPPHRGPSRRAPFFSVSQPASASPLFPYTTLFRSVHRHRDRTTRITPDHIRELHEEHLAHSGQLDRRSEEHTSELQSRGHLVCRLLLEKKKKGITNLASSACIVESGAGALRAPQQL